MDTTWWPAGARLGGRDRGDADLEMRARRDLAVLDGVEGALELVDVAAADPDVLEGLPGAGGELERAGERQVDLGGGAAGADAPVFLFDADRESARSDQLEEGALGVAGGDHRRGVELFAAGRAAVLDAQADGVGPGADRGARGPRGAFEGGDERRRPAGQVTAGSGLGEQEIGVGAGRPGARPGADHRRGRQALRE